MMVTTLEARGKVCLAVLMNFCESQLETCLAGECSAWEWDNASLRDGGEPLGHCALEGAVEMSPS
jgi:hypothetical protein